ncbi:M28 family metallopeptidase [Kozakia baliensis]|uniref:M28 family metallopeptidase n=1 Tax=Kozakia baliensis TaxID=153496 RepID=UPI0004981FD7|nr:M28 family metallopeptidase [Kozakia baliensis]
MFPGYLKAVLPGVAAAAFVAGHAFAQTNPASAYAPIDPARMSSVMRTLASDPFEGRAPGTPGEAKTIDYIIDQYKQIGLEPGGENGGWTQRVPLIHTKIDSTASVQAHIGQDRLSFTQLKEIYLNTLMPTDRISITDAPLVFVGYGVSAPDRQWDDYKGADLKGKVAVFLINDPDFDAKPGDSVAGRFGGKKMTYYGRWTYKYEEAARRGAVAALIVHDTPGASYGWSTVVAPGGEAFDIVRDGADKPVPLQGWIEGNAARVLFAKAGLSLAHLREQARRPDFHPVELPNVRLSASVPVTVEHLESRNVIAKLTGAKYPDQTVMYGAHWDAFGERTDAQGKKVIRRGAIDDGSGIAAVMEIARAFKAGPKPDRTVMFASWTAEERGLLGSTWYAAHPMAPLAKTAANFTIDVLQMAGPSHNAFIIGAGQDSLQDDFAGAVKTQGRTAVSEAMPERGAFYRADHLPFARAGVPVLPIMDMAGFPDLLKGGVPAGRQWLQNYMTCYHQACDAWSAQWDVRGAAEDTAALYRIGHTLAFSQTWPQWKPGSEFRAVRERTDAERSER